VFGLLGLLLIAGPASAHQVAGDDAPAAAECDQVEALGLTELLQVADDIGEQAEADAPNESATFLDPLPDGPEVDEGDLEGISETVRLLVACVNADDPLRIAALLSERFLAELALDLLEGTDRMEALVGELPILAGQFDSDEPMEMIEIASAVYDPDAGANGAVLAVLEPEIEDLGEQRSFVVRFVREDRVWQIDNVWLLPEA
jgi:hypothetical protein